MDTEVSNNEIHALLDQAYDIRGKDVSKSIELAREAHELSKIVGDENLIALSLARLSLFLMVTGKFDESQRSAERAIAYYSRQGNAKGVAEAKYSLAGICYKTDNHHKGLKYLIDCLSIYRKLRDYHNLARVYKSMGTVYEYFDDKKRAIEAYKKTLRAARKAEDIDLEANALNPLSGIYLNLKKHREAFRTIERSIAIKNKTGDTRGLAFALYGRGKIYIKTGDYELAKKDLDTAMATLQRVGDKYGIAMCYIKLGTLSYERGRLDEAIKILKEGLAFELGGASGGDGVASGVGG
ncbi:MAG: tetratricopeptide repeat protein, partial [Bacteroidota bacterium]